MLTIEFNFGVNIQWKVDSLTSRSPAALVRERVAASIGAHPVAVYANGAELDYIFASFRNIPQNTTASVQVWRGDLAQFIAENLV